MLICTNCNSTRHTYIEYDIYACEECGNVATLEEIDQPDDELLWSIPIPDDFEVTRLPIGGRIIA